MNIQKWEYRLAWIDIHMSPVLAMARWGTRVPGEKKPRAGMGEVEGYINEFGEQGWELTGVVNGSDKDGVMTRAVLFFRRPKHEQDR
ncbi:MAG TPA: hypothetical protein ENN51_07750 [candidate division WOR-3 bacterium]|uniref:DUF4177 domain-containing protein n=1 Tax=candidate division WOR-3 bacterium TaxID=2052148 RepID=A0A7V0T6N3_UNCW3|nr:hypothetical protein [candidate division WOR-3 bacterium]